MRIARQRRLWSDTDGQALTEAAIMLSLFCFAWVLAFYASYMGNQGIRTAAAARHGAWMKGNNVNQLGNLGGWFFERGEFFSSPSQVQDIENVPSLGPLFATVLKGQAYEVFHVDATFNAAGSTTFPFILTTVEYPILQENLDMPELDSYTTACEWVDCSDAWGANKSGLDDTFDVLMSVFGL